MIVDNSVPEKEIEALINVLINKLTTKHITTAKNKCSQLFNQNSALFENE